MYIDVLHVMLIDQQDAHLAPAITELGMRVVVTQTMMGGIEGRERLARDVLASIS
jgi:LPPG:FO 2-phospho-L-lactate transferase